MVSTWHCRDLLGFSSVFSSSVPVAVTYVFRHLNAFVHPPRTTSPTEARQWSWAGWQTICLHRRAAACRGSRALGQLHGSGRLKGHSRVFLQVPAKSSLFLAVLMLCSVPQNPAKQVDLGCLLHCASRSSPWYTSHIFSSSHSIPTEPLYSLQGIPSLPWCLCIVNIYRLLSCPSCRCCHSARLDALCSFNLAS